MEEAFKDTGKKLIEREPLEYKGRAATVRTDYEPAVAATQGEESFSALEEEKKDAVEKKSSPGLFEIASKPTQATSNSGKRYNNNNPLS